MAQMSKPAEERRRDRLEARVTEEQKRLFQRAAALQGQTLSDFLVSSARQAAERAIREHEVITLTLRDAEALMAALCSDDAPGSNLRRVAERYRAMLADS